MRASHLLCWWCRVTPRYWLCPLQQPRMRGTGGAVARGKAVCAHASGAGRRAGRRALASAAGCRSLRHGTRAVWLAGRVGMLASSQCSFLHRAPCEAHAAPAQDAHHLLGSAPLDPGQVLAVVVQQELQAVQWRYHVSTTIVLAPSAAVRWWGRVQGRRWQRRGAGAVMPGCSVGLRWEAGRAPPLPLASGLPQAASSASEAPQASTPHVERSLGPAVRDHRSVVRSGRLQLGLVASQVDLAASAAPALFLQRWRAGQGWGWGGGADRGACRRSRKQEAGGGGRSWAG